MTAGGPTVAVRVPAHPVARALIEAVGRPVVAPSANRSGYVSPTRVEHVQGLWPRSQVLVLDGGPCEVGLESTVVAVGERSLSVLRPGVVGARRLAEVAGVPVEPRARGDRREDLGVPAEAGRAGPGAPVGSPGLVGPHYQPRAPVVLVRTAEQAGSALASASQRRQRAVVLGPPGGDFQAPSGHEVLAMPGEGRAYARVLYEALRRADEAGPGLIVVFEPTQPGEVWDAVRERLGRASGGGLGGASVGSSGGAGTAG
ncbi:MAG: hypothetical protein KatS3mg103_1026 [Phycisphaerales bacterium]|nr:MAG: hypothetical protein KatS3mg103_1026 [Phycisphaerales bacterium]